MKEQETRLTLQEHDHDDDESIVIKAGCMDGCLIKTGNIIWSGSMDVDEERRTIFANF